MADFYEKATSVVDRAPARSKSPSFWRKRPPVFDDEGVVEKGGMFQHQLAWWDLPTFANVLVGGFGAGKTLAVCKRAMSVAIQNAPCPVAIVSPTYNVARQTTLATLADLAEGKRSIHGKGFWWTYNQTSHEFRIRFHGRDARIIQYSGDNPLSLRGPNLAAGYIDEPFIQEEEVFHQLVARIRHPNAVKKELGLTGTPEQLNWGYDLVSGELEGWGADKVGCVQASTRENEALSQDYIERLEQSFTEKAAAAYIEGDMVNLSKGLVYYSFNPGENVVDIDRPPAAELGAGMDFNVDPMAAVVFWQNGEHIHVFDEIELENADTEYMCDTLRERHGDSLMNIYPDASGRSRKTSSPGGKSDFYYIRQAGFRVNCHDSNPHRKDRYNSVNGKFKPKRGRHTLTISPKCRKLKGYLQKYTHEGMNKASHKAMSHLLDALGYPVAFLFPVDREAIAVRRLRGA